MDKHSFERRIGRFRAFGILLLVLVVGASAFQIRTKNEISPPPPRIEGAYGGGGRGFDARDVLDILPRSTGDNVDLDKARDFAKHYGKYTYEEVEHMRNDLHADRVKNDSPDDVLFLERYLEDELTSQLQSLKDEMPNPYLFRYSDEDVPKGLFGSEAASIERTGTASTTDTHNAFELPALLLEEGVLETLAIFMVAGILMMPPQ
mmetsp:Transcript_22936/g.54246  ORF Transcript_22936/g.54246 Transcript_22936/m.54246 type:complete len:205 (-) Transcript_22936:67-681(-)